MWWRREKRFRLSGGRAGIIAYQNGERRAELEWEMLVGEFGLVVYADRARWRAPADQPLTRDEARELLRELAKEMKTNIELAFSDGTELIYWRGAV